MLLMSPTITTHHCTSLPCLLWAACTIPLLPTINAQSYHYKGSRAEEGLGLGGLSFPLCQKKKILGWGPFRLPTSSHYSDTPPLAQTWKKLYCPWFNQMFGLTLALFYWCLFELQEQKTNKQTNAGPAVIGLSCCSVPADPLLYMCFLLFFVLFLFFGECNKIKIIIIIVNKHYQEYMYSNVFKQIS